MERQPFFFEVRLQLKLNSMKKRIYNLALISTALPIFFLACKKDSTTPTATLVKEWTVLLSVKNEIRSHAGRTETGTATIRLLSDNTITYQITVNGLTSGDGLTAAHIHAGNVITSGPVVLGFDPVFTGSTATGTIKNIRSTFIDSLKDDVNELYFNVHSTQQPGGLIRGQLNVGIEMAEDVVLLGTHEATPVTTTATGLAILRLTDDKKLYSKVTITNLEAGDTVVAAHIHTGPTGVNGPVIVGLCAKAADFGTAKIFTLTDALFTTVKTEAVYVNAHSVNHPGGVIRGQIR